MQVGRGRVDLERWSSGRTARRTGPVYQTTAWPAVRPTSARITIFRFFHWPKDSVSGALEVLPSAFIFWKAGDSFSDSRIHTETASSTIETRNGMRQPQSLKASSPMPSRTPRITSSDRNRPSVAVVWIQRGVGAALAVRRMLGHVGRRTAVLAAQRQALQQAQRDQDDRRGDADGGVAGQEADDEGRHAHDQDGDQEGVLAPDHVAQAAEHDGAERAAPGSRRRRPAARR